MQQQVEIFPRIANDLSIIILLVAASMDTSPFRKRPLHTARLLLTHNYSVPHFNHSCLGE